MARSHSVRRCAEAVFAQLRPEGEEQAAAQFLQLCALCLLEARGWLPQDVLERKKSPYPKTHNPGYEQLLKNRLQEVLRDPAQPLHMLIAEDVARGLLNESFDYGRPWFGQLMAGPQLLAYLLQVNFWLQHYGIRIRL